MSHEQGQVVVAGVRSPVRQAAPQGREGDREAVVFVHGNPGSSEDWLPLLSAAGGFARAVAPDMPGFGKADRPEDFEYTVPGYAAHLDGVLSELGVERAHLVLHDFGGPWGLQWAADHPERVASLTLFNMGAMPGYRWHKFARIWRTPILGELVSWMTTRGAFRFSLNQENPKPFPREFVDRMYDDMDAGTHRAVLKLYRATDDVGAYSVELAAKLKPHGIPTLVLWGDGDPFLSVAFAAHQPEHLGVEAHILPGCGHWPMVDEPEQVEQLVIPFLRQCATA